MQYLKKRIYKDAGKASVRSLCQKYGVGCGGSGENELEKKWEEGKCRTKK